MSLVQDSEDAEDVNQTVPTIWNYFKVVGVQSKKGGAKNVTCTFCDKTLTGCSSSCALAHILGRPVLEQSKANVRFCVPIRKEDDDRYEQFKTAQKVLNKQVMTKEAQLSSSKSRQTVLDLTSLGKRTVTGEMKTVESKTLDSAIANVFYENALPFNVADSPSLAHMVEKCIEFGQQHPGRKYKAPNRKRIGGALLDTAYEDTAASVQPIVDRAKKYGATLTSDGWSDVQRRPITNFMLVTRESALSQRITWQREERRMQRTLQIKSTVSSRRSVENILFRLLWTEQTEHAGPSLTLRSRILFVRGALLMLWICCLKTSVRWISRWVASG